MRLQSPSSPGLNQAAPSLAVGMPDPLYGEADDKDIKRKAEGCYIVMNTETIQEASLLLLFDGLNAFHQILFSLCV